MRLNESGERREGGGRGELDSKEARVQPFAHPSISFLHNTISSQLFNLSPTFFISRLFQKILRANFRIPRRLILAPNADQPPSDLPNRNGLAISLPSSAFQPSLSPNPFTSQLHL